MNFIQTLACLIYSINLTSQPAPVQTSLEPLFQELRIQLEKPISQFNSYKATTQYPAAGKIDYESVALPIKSNYLDSYILLASATTQEGIVKHIFIDASPSKELLILETFNKLRGFQYKKYSEYGPVYHEWSNQKLSITMFPPLATSTIKSLTILIDSKVPTNFQKSLDASAIFKRASSSVGIVKSLDLEDKLIATGSCVITELGFLTNWHVVSNSYKVLVSIDKEDIIIDKIKRHSSLDLALLQVNTPLQLFSNNPPFAKQPELLVGQKVFAIGSPKGFENTISEGIISGFRTDKDGSYIQTTAPISPGSSGGGLFDSSGKIVGITTSYIKDGQNLNFAIPMTQSIFEMLMSLEDVNIKKQTSNHYIDSYKAMQLEFKMGNYDKSLEICQTLLRSHPDYAQLWQVLGLIQFKLHQYSQCIQSCDESIRLNPDNLEPYEFAIRSNVLLHNKVGTQFYFDKLKIRFPNDANRLKPLLSIYIQ